MGFNFSEEEISNMYGMYESVLNEIQEQAKSISEEIIDIANNLKYEPVVKLSIEAVSYYNEELKRAAQSALTEWQGSDLSFSKIMDKLSAGESAKNRSRELESVIQEVISSWKAIEDGGLSGMDTSNPRCEVEDFEIIKESINRFLDSMTELQNQYSSKIESAKLDNDIYVSIEPVILQTIMIVSDGFKTGIEDSFSELAQEFANRESEVKSMGNSAAQVAASKAQSFVSSGASALKAKVKTIMD